MPVILASTLLAIPSFIAGIVKKEAFTNFITNYLSTNTPVGFVLYILLIFVFAYFYTFLQLKPSEMSDNLNKNGGYIPGIKPGNDTTEYLSKVLGRITMVGALFLAILAGLPVIFAIMSKLSSVVTLGGTSLLIVVGVALETYKQLESQLQSRTYRRR